MLKPRCAQDITPSTNKITRMRHNGVMPSPKYSRISTRIGQIFVVTALVVGGAPATAYIAARLRRQRETHHLADTRPQHVHTAEDIALPATAATEDVKVFLVADVAALDTGADNSNRGMPEDRPGTLAALTVGELYQLAQQHDIMGRSSMRKAQLIEALHAAGVTAPTS